MLDVHAPHHPTHGWRDFFIHIATIVVGLFIALGLEQSVEAMHRHHERSELLKALNKESEQIVSDTVACEKHDVTVLAWTGEALQQVTSDLRDRKPYAGLPSKANFPIAADLANDPIYKAARASGKLALLTDQEIAAYGELDQVITREYEAVDHLRVLENAVGDRVEALALYRSPQDPSAYSNVPGEQVLQLYTILGQYKKAQTRLISWEVASGGGAAAILRGERDLTNIEHAERPSNFSLPYLPAR
jgi:predicted component of type VI protein secretion system